MKKITMLLAITALAACAGFNSPIRKEISEQRYFSAATMINGWRSNNPKDAREILMSGEMQQGKPLLVQQAVSEINATQYWAEYKVRSILETADMLRAHGLISSRDISTIREALSNRLAPVLLATGGAEFGQDVINEFPELNTPEFHRKRYNALRNKITSQNTSSESSTEVELLAQLAHKIGPGSQEHADFAALLPSMRLTKRELERGPIMALFPHVAGPLVRARQVSLYVSLTPEDPLLADDLSKMLGDQDWTSLQTTPYDGKGIHVAIKKLRFEERTQPTRSETQTVANMNLGFAALLFVPRGASMQFDVLHDEAALDYGFEYSIIKDGKPVKRQVVRDRLSASSKQCTNMRYVNVFGGVNAVDFYPNDSVQHYCTSNSGKADIDSIRQKAYSMLADKVKGDISDVVAQVQNRK